MNNTERSPLRTGLIAAALFGIGVAIAIFSNMRAEQYYYADYADADFGQLVREPYAHFIATRAGRYEVSNDIKFGELTFSVANAETAQNVPVSEFGLFASLAGARDHRGFAFDIDRPGEYTLTTTPFPDGAEIELDFKDTEAVGRWAVGGLLAGTVPFILSFVYLIRLGLRGPRPNEAASAK